ncbi:MAG: hypothetical protein AAFX96_09375 [Pseudomonadota bacterium]
MDADAVLANMRTGLVGMPLSLLWQGYGSAIFLEFGSLTPAGKRRDGAERNPTGEFSIGIEWSWRIESQSSIVCGSWSEEGEWQPAFDLIRNTHLSALNTYSRLPELDLHFANGYHLLSFNTSEGQPDWFLIDRRLEESITLIVDNGHLAIEEKQ